MTHAELPPLFDPLQTTLLERARCEHEHYQALRDSGAWITHGYSPLVGELLDALEEALELVNGASGMLAMPAPEWETRADELERRTSAETLTERLNRQLERRTP